MPLGSPPAWLILPLLAIVAIPTSALAALGAIWLWEHLVERRVHHPDRKLLDTLDD